MFINFPPKDISLFTLVILLIIFSLSGCNPAPRNEVAKVEAFDQAQTPSQTHRPSSTPGSKRTTTTSIPLIATRTELPANTKSPTSPPTISPTASQTPTLPPNGYVLFEDDFEGGTENWLFTKDSSWKINSDESGNHYLCVYGSENKTYAYPKNFQGTNFNLELDFMQIEPALSFDIYLRFNSSTGYTYYLGLNAITPDENGEIIIQNNVEFIKNDQAGFHPDISTKEWVKNLLNNQWYSLNARAMEGNISYTLDGTQVININDDDYIPEGKIRLGIEYGTLCFDNVHVTFLGDK